MKRISNVLFVFVLLFSLTAACQSSGGSGKENQPQTLTPEPLERVAPIPESDESAPAIEVVDVEMFREKMKTPGIMILDVRTLGEAEQGKIEGARVFDVRSPSFREDIHELDPNGTYLVYCRSGKRSTQACEILKEEGFKHLYNLKGGYMAWTQAGN